MEATDSRVADEAATLWHDDPTEARLVERVIAVARSLLAMTAVAAIHLGPLEPTRDVRLTSNLVLGYAAFATILLAVLLRARTIPRWLPLVVHTADICFAAALTLFSAGSNGPLFTFLLYPLLAAAYRWGFREVMWTAVIVDVLLGVEAILTGSLILSAGEGPPQVELNALLLRAVYVAATGAAVGYLAENEKRRRLEARAMALLLAQGRLGGKLGDAINLAMASTKSIFRAKQVVLVLYERHSEHAWLWTTGPGGHDGTIPRPEPLPAPRLEHYVFEAPGAAWHAVPAIAFRRGRFAVVALDERGRQVRAAKIALPEGFLAAHPCRRLIGTSLDLGEEWRGRLFVLEPRYGVHRERSARLALQLVNEVGPAVYSHYLLRRLRTRARSDERNRIARELHDGVTQSLLGLEMEIVVLHRRAVTGAPELADDLVRVHRIVRREIVTVRELMEGLRVGDVESGELLPHLRDVVDRFGRYTGVAARFESDGTAVSLTPHVRREVARVVHEALVNVRRHSHADRVLVRADVEGARWKVSIEDNGRGFSFSGRLSQEELERLRQGPRTIGERVRLIGGEMTVESKPGVGSRLEIAVPLQAKP